MTADPINFLDQEDDILIYEPILAKKDCKIKISFAETAEWKVKEHVPGYAGEIYKALKLTVLITDQNVQTENDDAKARLTIEDQFNVVKYPYLSKKTGQVEWLNRAKLYQLEDAFGFDPFFAVDGVAVAPHITKNGRKVAPKIAGAKQRVNPDFWTAYFNEDGTPKPDNWIDKEILADIGVDKNEQFGARNTILRYKKPYADSVIG